MKNEKLAAERIAAAEAAHKSKKIKFTGDYSRGSSTWDENTEHIKRQKRKKRKNKKSLKTEESHQSDLSSEEIESVDPNQF